MTETSAPLLREKSIWWDAAILLAIWLFHAVNNLVYFATTDTPPSYDCGYHLQLSVNFYENLVALGQEDYFKRLYFSSSFYPLFGYMAATPFYLVLGVSQDSANVGHLLYLALLLYSVYRIGRRVADRGTGLFAALLVSLFPFVYGISRVYYVESAMMAATAYAIWRLLLTEGFTSFRGSLMFGLSAGLGMMTKWTFPLFLAGPVGWVLVESFWKGSKENPGERLPRPSIWEFDLGGILLGLGIGLTLWAGDSDHPGLWVPLALLPGLAGIGLAIPYRPFRSRLLHMAVAGAAMAVMCYPWYARNWELIRGVAMPFMDASHTEKINSSWARATQPEGFLYYPLAIQANHLGPFLSICFLFALGLFPYRRARVYGPLIVWVAISFLVITLIPTRDSRYVSPILPGIGILMALAFCRWEQAWFRYGLAGLAMVLGLWQFGLNSYNLPFPKGNHFALSRYAHFYSFYNHGTYGTGSERTVHYPHREAIAAFKQCVRTASHTESETPSLRCLIDLPQFHQGAFEFYARADGRTWTALFDREFLNLAPEWNRAARADAVLFANQDLPDDLYTLPGRPLPYEYNQGERSFFQLRFPLQENYPLPNGATVTLACRGEGMFLRDRMDPPIPIRALGMVRGAKAQVSSATPVTLTVAFDIGAKDPAIQEEVQIQAFDAKGGFLREWRVAPLPRSTEGDGTTQIEAVLPWPEAPRGAFQLAVLGPVSGATGEATSLFLYDLLEIP